ncbi:hypothetical protein LQ318_13990 [Aliifodinibius salicampi]|uniref:Yip1 domain-containing protein n=1 Tax=Fodinibius salicampi TaxID=1920655 RepID=A0ABT3Q1X5_9BACT|nr:hypothetical protein [Fodinibius salicampi]MCW9714018.1 hypothetical protein [Fodinibius salicampi]
MLVKRDRHTSFAMTEWFFKGLFTIIILLFFAGSIHAQRNFGVVWELPESEQQALDQLSTFQETGITILELNEQPSDRLWETINQYNFEIYASLGISFPTPLSLARTDSATAAALIQKAKAFLSQPSVEKLKLFQFGAIEQSAFNTAASSFFASFNNLDNIDTYYTDHQITDTHPPADFLIYDIRLHSTDLDSLTIPRSEFIGGYQYSPDPKLQGFLTPLKRIIEQTSHSPGKPLLFRSSQLLSTIENNPQLGNTLRAFASTPNAIFPVPEESLPSSRKPILPTIVLLLVWGSLAMHYNMSPLYRKSLFRYFFGHSFFVNDIFRRHIRTSVPAMLILLQHALLAGAVLYTLSTYLWSPLGLQSLAYHYPMLEIIISGNEYILLLVFSGIFLMLSLIAIFWLYLSNKYLRSLTQVTTLLAWPFHLNFLIGTFAIAVYVSWGSIYAITAATILLLFVFFCSFIVAAIDLSRAVVTNKLRYLSLTVGLYLLLITALTVWMVGFNSSVWEVIYLSLKL